MTMTAGAASLAPPFNAKPSSVLDAAYSKVAWRLIPFLMVLWILAWIDRVNIGFAKLQMLGELRFSETVYASAQASSSWATSSSRCRATCCWNGSAPSGPSPGSPSAEASPASP